MSESFIAVVNASIQRRIKRYLNMIKNPRNSKQYQIKQQSSHGILQVVLIAVAVIVITSGIIYLSSYQADALQAQPALISQPNNYEKQLVQNSQVELVQSVVDRQPADPYADVSDPMDCTDETPIQIYNRGNGLWEKKTYSDVGPDMEFIVGNYVYATTPEQGFLFLKPELEIVKLA